MNKKTEIEILTYLKNSKTVWTDIFPLLDIKNGTYPEHTNFLKGMIDDGHIKFENENSISYLKLSKRGKLWNPPVLNAKITKEGETYLSSISFLSKIQANERVRLIKDIVTLIASIVAIFISIQTCSRMNEMSQDGTTNKQITKETPTDSTAETSKRMNKP